MTSVEFWVGRQKISNDLAYSPLNEGLTLSPEPREAIAPRKHRVNVFGPQLTLLRAVPG